MATLRTLMGCVMALVLSRSLITAAAAEDEVYCVGWPWRIRSQDDFFKSNHCTVLFGSLEIRDVEWNQSLPKLRFKRISGYLFISGVRGFKTFSHLLPNLTTIYGLSRVSWSKSMKAVSTGTINNGIDIALVDIVITDTTLQSIDRDLMVRGTWSKSRDKLPANQSPDSGYFCPSIAVVRNPLLCGFSLSDNCKSKTSGCPVENGGENCQGRTLKTQETTFKALQPTETPWVMYNATEGCPPLRCFSNCRNCTWMPDNSTTDCSQAYPCLDGGSVEWTDQRAIPCLKECQTNIEITSLKSICDYPIGCTKIRGNFRIVGPIFSCKDAVLHLPCYSTLLASGLNVTSEDLLGDVLHASFNNVETIEGSLTITSTSTLASLSFLPNLSRIKGIGTLTGFAVLVSGNTWLSDLGFLTKKNLTFGTAQNQAADVFISYNDNLCPEKVHKMSERPNIKVTAKENGHMAACLTCIKVLEPHDHTLRWEAIENDKQCHKSIVGAVSIACPQNSTLCFEYVVFFKRVTGQMRPEDVRSPCQGFEYGWSSKNVYNTSINLDDLVDSGEMLPCTNYSLIVCAFAFEEDSYYVISPARSNITSVVSPPSEDLSPPRHVTVQGINSTAVVISWQHSPSSNYFRVRVTHIPQLKREQMEGFLTFGIDGSVCESIRRSRLALTCNPSTIGGQRCCCYSSKEWVNHSQAASGTEKILAVDMASSSTVGKENAESCSATKTWTQMNKTVNMLIAGEVYVIDVQTTDAGKTKFSAWNRSISTSSTNMVGTYYHADESKKKTPQKCKATPGWLADPQLANKLNNIYYESQLAVSTDLSKQILTLYKCMTIPSNLQQYCRRVKRGCPCDDERQGNSGCDKRITDSLHQNYTVVLACRNISPICLTNINLTHLLSSCSELKVSGSIPALYAISGYSANSICGLLTKEKGNLTVSPEDKDSTSELTTPATPTSGSSRSMTATIVAIALSVVAFILILFLVLLWQRHQVAREKIKECPLKLAYELQTGNPAFAIYNEYEPDEHWEVSEDNVKLIRELGQGQFGMVYEGEYTYPDTGAAVQVAVKTTQQFQDKIQRNIFLQEASVMKKFDSPYVTCLLGIVSKANRPLVLMEYLAHGDLKAYLMDSRPQDRRAVKKSFTSISTEKSTCLPSTERFLQWALNLTLGMSHLEAKRFVHRDLAARNCMLSADLTLKVGDFGMTRDIYQSDYYRKKGHGMLPLRWLSPEALRDGVYVSASDVWSYGIVLWEMATLGELPYQGKSNEEVLEFVMGGGQMSLPITQHEFPEQLEDIMLQCWQTQADQRPTFTKIAEKLVKSGAQTHLPVGGECGSDHGNTTGELENDVFRQAIKFDVAQPGGSNEVNEGKYVYDDPLM